MHVHSDVQAKIKFAKSLPKHVTKHEVEGVSGAFVLQNVRRTFFSFPIFLIGFLACKPGSGLLALEQLANTFEICSKMRIRTCLHALIERL
jgi:hypothetical protein